jgi:integrase/recombinase XerD
MQYPTVNVVHNRLNYKSKSELYPVYLRIYCNGKTDYIKIKNIPKIHSSDWIGNDRQARWVRKDLLVNDKISAVLDEARKFINAQMMKGNMITTSTIKEHFANPTSRESFNEFVRIFIRDINKGKIDSEKRAYRTIQMFDTFLRRLDEFNDRIAFDGITPQLVHKFDQFLIIKHKLTGTTREKYFDKFKVCYEAAVMDELVEDNRFLFKGLNIKREKSTKVQLNDDEIKRFKYTTINDPINDFYRKIFFLQLNTGLYYSDLCLLKVHHFKQNVIEEHGVSKEVYYLENTRSKNDQPFTIKLFKDALEILEQYSTKNTGAPDDLLFPDLISEQKYNNRLKVIAKELNIEKNLSNKVARHSFGAWMMRINNTREKVGKSMGHTNERTTRIYSELDTRGALMGWHEPEI